jgi:Fe-S cluster biogenesis protein NfuA/nitrite reductase/ring-hydroxylating ferredoxin subunit
MPQHKDVRAAGERIDRLLDGLRADPVAAKTAEDLVQTLVDLYGEGLSKMLEIVADTAPEVIDKLVEDQLVESLMLIHDLHPYDLDTRIQRALDGVRPYLGSHAGGVTYTGVDRLGVVQLTLEGNCNGCASSAVTVQLAIEKAILDAAPETAGVHVEGVVEPKAAGPKLMQIGRRAPEAPSHSPAIPLDADGWAKIPAAPTVAAVRVLNLGGVKVLVCRGGDSLYAYRDGCPECGATLADATLAEDVLSCAACQRRYHVKLAGLGVDDPGRHLDPLPLLVDAGGTRVAVTAAVGAAR